MTLTPTSTALLVMDYQNGIIPMLADPDALLAREAEVIARVRSAGAHVAYVRVGFTADEIAAMPAASGIGAAIAGRGDALAADGPATQVHDALAPHDGDIVVRKTRVGPFLTTDLDAQLRSRGIDTLVLTGISTSGVVLSTVPDAYDRDFRLIVLSDLVADPDAEIHRVLIEHVFPKRAQVIRSEEFVGLL